ncbi:hypothetical protein MNBD_GAMMA01-791 [hydrothermal vent metagenome]|uniref:Uncharacterized protein n=1 Tax=hydrothermal vent metagenome TaxID=652676 RepID=A0A3B0VBQ2_9ZZZZ
MQGLSVYKSNMIQVGNKEKKTYLVFFVGFYILYVFLYIVFMPDYEQPDELIHIKHVLAATELKLSLTGDGNLYYYVTNKIFGFFEDVVHADFPQVAYVDSFKFFNDDFRFHHQTIHASLGVILLRLTNFIYFFVLMALYLLFFRTRQYDVILFSLLVFPGILSFFSSVNPDVLNIFFAFLVSLLLIRKLYLIAIILSCAAFFFLDRTIIVFISSVLLFVSIPRGKIKKFLFYLLLILSLILSIRVLGQIIYGIHTDYEPIKSLVTLGLSYYGLLGSMSIKATYFEYLIFFILSLLYLKEVFAKSFYMESYNYRGFSHFLLIYFILWQAILYVGSSLDQGRFFYPLHFIIVFLIIHRFYGFLQLNYSKIIFILISCSLFINIHFVYKLIILGEVF